MLPSYENPCDIDEYEDSIARKDKKLIVTIDDKRKTSYTLSKVSTLIIARVGRLLQYINT